jgi:glycosyltransferase involved in cell wall biosynthesis
MKILHVASDLSPRQGGPAKLAPEMCRVLARRGHEVALYTTNFDVDGVLDVPLERPVMAGGYTTRYFPVSWPRRWKFSRPLGEAIRADVAGFDIVHIHNLYLYHTWVTAHYCRRYGIPYLISPHGTLDPFIRRRSRLKKAIYHGLIEQRNLNRAAAIHYTAQFEMDLAHRAVSIKAPGVVAPLGLELQDYLELPRPGAFRRRFPEIGGDRIILFLSRINFKKGLDLLAKSFGILARQRDDVRLVIAGPDNDGYGGQVRQWLSEAGVLSRTVFTGMLTGEDKLAALADADLFVLPSYSENFGIAIIEAMACGLPVVISNRVNIWREIAGAGAGVVVDCDVQSLAEALLKLLDDPEGRREIGAKGRRLVEATFVWDKVAAQMIGLYQQILTRS